MNNFFLVFKMMYLNLMSQCYPLQWQADSLPSIGNIFNTLVSYEEEFIKYDFFFHQFM